VTLSPHRRRRLTLRLGRSLVVQVVGAAVFLIAGGVFFAQGNWAGGLVFSFLGLFPLGAAVAVLTGLRALRRKAHQDRTGGSNAESSVGDT